MTRILRALACAAAGIFIWTASVSTGHPAGAMAVGSCAAFGYAFDYADANAAGRAAPGKCTGAEGKGVMMLKKSCAAFPLHRPPPRRPPRYPAPPRLPT